MSNQASRPFVLGRSWRSLVRRPFCSLVSTSAAGLLARRQLRMLRMGGCFEASDCVRLIESSPTQGAVLAGGNCKVTALLQIFSELAKIGPVVEGEQEEPSSRSPWCNTEPHPGLRAYPFLSQVRRMANSHACRAPLACREPGGAQQSIEEVC